ncbi:ovochymase-2-like isoform X2 [Toxorhynchites rutilus septentrionalis]|uniref:ovochymase-2-like isoform X2 n=1 Tax=Toxorhynchites rutilus septentrionalis TaxID=329112 RepID=UPI0024787F69|nr:ovochymase-2-like isoform X2 [Toxorhynchites rutilus septentrionalis]
MERLVYCGFLFLISSCARGQDDEVLMLHNERTTLDDCHMRFHKLRPDVPVRPASGHPARLKEFAHIGAIGWTQPNGNISWKCGGTLIWFNFVLTAAHCAIDPDNRAPDVVRFGDLNILTAEGDKYAQQLKIAAIFRHPLHRFTAYYHDIALLKLERHVSFSEVVFPACLWMDEEVRFDILEAAGWGRTGYAQEQTPILLKVALKPIENEECSKVYSNGTDRMLRLGLQQHQMCAVDEKMDTCEGDSGGPLQIKLLHNTRVTPFVVGITSFGSACGTSAPGVYTKVAPYRDWIVETMQKNDDTFNATTCAIYFVYFREYEDAIITYRTPEFVGVDSSKRHMFLAEGLPSYIVQLAWDRETNDCFGVIIDENTVLTIAQCVTKNRKYVSHVIYSSNNTMKISKIHIHPKYKQGSSYNNIAILRLQHLLNMKNIEPACIWHGELPQKEVYVHGSGRTDINTMLPFGSYISSSDPSISSLTPRVRLQNASSCIVPKRYQSLLSSGVTNEHICNGQNLFLVPESCELRTGAAVHDVIKRAGADYPMVYGLNYIGRDCGFGEHSIAIGTASHIAWMKTVLLSNHDKSHGIVHFVDRDLQEGDACDRYDRRAAQCVPVSKCPREWKQFLLHGTIELCSTSSSVCCPLNDIADTENSVIHPQFAGCPSLVEGLKPTSSLGSLVFIACQSPNGLNFRCLGTIITERIILTSASCVEDDIPSIVKLVTNTTQKMYPVNAILVHNAFNSTDNTNDIAMIRLEDSLTWSSDLYPACLWTNTTHVPLVLSMVSPVKSNNITKTEVLAMYNSDCQRNHDYELKGTQLCARDPFRNLTCTTMSDQLHYGSKNGVTYIVGLSTILNNCESSPHTVFTRVSSFVDWIGINI